MSLKILVTGANGHLGQQLIRVLLNRHEVIAVVRSESALAQLEAFGCRKAVVDYSDEAALSEVMSGCHCVVHLVGIIRKNRYNSYVEAHESPCRSLARAANTAGIRHVIALSVLGSDPGERNACLASRGRSEEILLAGKVPVSIIRVPMVLGEGDHASRSVKHRAMGRLTFTFRAGSLEQPVYAGDVIRAICALIEHVEPMGLLELAGPECLSRRELYRRAARILGTKPVVISLPAWIGKLTASLLEMLMASPPVTRDMIDLLDHDDSIETEEVTRKLGMELTGLDEMLQRVLLRG